MTARTRLLLPLGVTILSAMLCGCEYGKMLRPSTLKQLNPDVVRLVDELPEVDQPHKEIIARLFAHGGLDHAKLGSDGVYRANIRVPEGQYIWKPSIIVMKSGGDLELEFLQAVTLITRLTCPAMAVRSR